MCGSLPKPCVVRGGSTYIWQTVDSRPLWIRVRDDFNVCLATVTDRQTALLPPVPVGLGLDCKFSCLSIVGHVDMWTDCCLSFVSLADRQSAPLIEVRDWHQAPSFGCGTHVLSSHFLSWKKVLYRGTCSMTEWHQSSSWRFSFLSFLMTHADVSMTVIKKAILVCTVLLQ